MKNLTERQLEVARLIADGYSNVEIGEKLGITARTVKALSDVVRRKLGVEKRREIVRALREYEPVA